MWVLEQNWEREIDDGEFEPPPSPTVVIVDADHLRTVLESKAAGEPYFFTLCSPDGVSLGLWLGGPWGMIDFHRRMASGRSYRTVEPKVVQAPVEVHFQDGREGCLLGPERLIPATEVIDAAVYFFEHGELPPRLNWIGWDA
jgi:hypothetical protein